MSRLFFLLFLSVSVALLSGLAVFVTRSLLDGRSLNSLPSVTPDTRGRVLAIVAVGVCLLFLGSLSAWVFGDEIEHVTGGYPIIALAFGAAVGACAFRLLYSVTKR
jgi:hypothetical protein